MIDDYTFNSVDDLYKRLLPAINTKLSELKRIHIDARNTDIWNYCVTNIWKKRKDLRIHEMVSDILDIDELKLNEFIKSRNG